MSIHKNARLTLIRRQEMVQDVIELKITLTATAAAHGVSVPSVRKWVGTLPHPWGRRAVGRVLAAAGQPARHCTRARGGDRRTASPLLTHARIARSLQVSPSTVGRVLRRAHPMTLQQELHGVQVVASCHPDQPTQGLTAM